MSDRERNEERSESGHERPEAEIRERRAPSLVWLIPLLAALIGAGLWFESYSQRGPRITIDFADASGLEAGKTKIKYKAMEIGLITELELREDLEGVIAHAELEKGSAPFLSKDTAFWVVRPHIGASGISGLDTLVSGAYVGVLPAKGKRERHFQALEKAPLRAEHVGALGINLRADELGSIREGSPIYYRSIRAGEVERYVLDDDGGGVTIHALIDKAYAHLVRDDTQFWNASGIEADLSAAGLKIHVSSLASLLAGGIVFDNSSDADGNPVAGRETTFTLYPHPDAALAARHERDGINVYVEAERVGGIAKDAPVFYRDLEVGYVADFDLAADARAVRFRLHIDPEHAPLVRRNTRFFQRDALRVHAGLDGIDIEAGSLTQMMAGGIGFATPTRVAEMADEGELFVLHDKAQSAWLAWSPTIWIDESQKGQDIHHVALRQPAAPGLEFVLEAPATGSVRAGAPIHYRKIRVGAVLGHALAPDAKTVRIRARIEKRYATLVRDNSVFWNSSGVRVHAGLDGVDIETGSLKTLVEGGVTFATPDAPGREVSAGHLFALEERAEREWLAWSPAIWVDGDARPIEHVAATVPEPEPLRVVLEAENAKSVREGAPIYYRKIRIGKLGKHALRPDGRRVQVDALIDAEHAGLVRENTVFWNAAGIAARLSLGGLEIETESLEAFLEGGVALATPDPPGAFAGSGDTFALHAKALDEWRQWAPALSAGSDSIALPEAGQRGGVRSFLSRLFSRDAKPLQTADRD